MSNSFHPPQRILMGPGPSDVPDRVREAMARPTLGHLDPEFITMMDAVRELLQYAFQTDNRLTLPVSAPGSAGMECCFANLVEPGDQVIVCQNGVFGGRMKENVIRCGGRVIAVDVPWGEPVAPRRLEETLKAHPEARLVAFVQAETSTGVLSDTATLVDLAHRYGCLTIVDAVTSLGGIELRVDEWGIDAVYSGTQKCLSCVPGLAPVSFNETAWERIQARRHPVQSWFLDLQLLTGYWAQGHQRAYHHTAPVNTLYALHEALLILQEEGLENAWQRHRLHHQALAAGLQALGLELSVAEKDRLPQLNAVSIPAGLDDSAIRRRLLQEYNLEIGAGLGAFAGRLWRIGLMGQSCCRHNVLYCLAALESVLAGSATTDTEGTAIRAASDCYTKQTAGH